MISNQLANGSLFTMMLAMVPLLELRGAIPYGIAQGLPFWQVFFLAFIGNMIPVPFIILFIRRLFEMLYKAPVLGELVERMEKKAHLKGDIVNRYRMLGLFLLVAAPIPGTGAWTAALVVAYLDIRLTHAFPVIALGVMVSGLLVAGISYSAFSFL